MTDTDHSQIILALLCETSLAPKHLNLGCCPPEGLDSTCQACRQIIAFASATGLDLPLDVWRPEDDEAANQ